MTRGAFLIVALTLAACRTPRGGDEAIAATAPPPPPAAATLPRAPDQFAPSLLRLTGASDAAAPIGSVTRGPAAPAGFGDTLADVDTCSTCHPDVAAQWNASAHSFASFGNPIYRANVEITRHQLGRPASQHCGGCHDLPLEVDGTMLGDIPPTDLRAHSGVTCRVCHGIDAVTSDGNGSYVLRTQPIPTPDLNDPTSIALHKQRATLRPLGADVCGACHRGFLSPDLGMPVHISGLDEPTAWKSSAWTGNGMGRVDKVDARTCIDCHMASEAASKDEVAAHDGVVMSHRFLGGHTWMAGMRGDADQLARLQAHLKGVASIDVAGVLVASAAGAPRTAAGAWIVPADGAPVVPGARLGIEVVVRNLLVGHRFPGGVLDMQDTWIELEVSDARGARLASSGLGHDRDPDDPDGAGGAHVLRSFPVGDDGAIRDLHEMPEFRAIAANQTVAPRDATVVRYRLDVPASLPAAALPLRIDARLRHRSRSLREQRAVCDDARTPDGRAFFGGAQGARGVTLDPCKPQPITEIAATTTWIGGPAPAGAVAARPAWERGYELGMALVGEVGERLDEARVVLEAARTMTPAGVDGDRPRAMIDVQLAWVAGKQGRTEDALALVEQARRALPKAPPVLDAIAADALARVWRWKEAIAPAEAAARKAPGNTQAWVVLARVLASAGDDRGALAAARGGLAIAPRDADLLRTQAVALRALGSPLADAALAAYDRFRAPDDAAQLRITCADRSPRCEREREIGHTHVLVAPPR